MRVIIGCEFSGVVRRAFRARGHDAWSCDLVPAYDNSPYHYQQDLRTLDLSRFDLGIFHPDCTYLTRSGGRWNKEPARKLEQIKAIEFVKWIWGQALHKLSIENPIGVLSTQWQAPTQYVQPWEHGHGETKRTCLWLKNLPPLKPTNIVSGRIPAVHFDYNTVKKGLTRKQRRSITYDGIAKAMAEQWG